jgi:hypothetical protein
MPSRAAPRRSKPPTPRKSRTTRKPNPPSGGIDLSTIALDWIEELAMLKEHRTVRRVAELRGIDENLVSRHIGDLQRRLGNVRLVTQNHKRPGTPVLTTEGSFKMLWKLCDRCGLRLDTKEHNLKKFARSGRINPADAERLSRLLFDTDIGRILRNTERGPAPAFEGILARSALRPSKPRRASSTAPILPSTDRIPTRSISPSWLTAS